MEDNFIKRLREQEAILGDLQSNLHHWMNELLCSAWDPEVFLRYAASLGIDLSQLPNATKGQGDVDPYKVLGLKNTASDREVKQRYRELLKYLHPDTAGVAGTGSLLQTVINAYQQIARERKWES